MLKNSQQSCLQQHQAKARCHGEMLCTNRHRRSRLTVVGMCRTRSLFSVPVQLQASPKQRVQLGRRRVVMHVTAAGIAIAAIPAVVAAAIVAPVATAASIVECQCEEPVARMGSIGLLRQLLGWQAPLWHLRMGL